MYFKSAVSVFAVYFLTSVWSIGLNSVQLKLLNTLYKNSPTGITDNDSTQFVKQYFGIEPATNIFRNDPILTNLVNLNYALRWLVINDNLNSDQVKNKKLNPFEVDYYLDVFFTHAVTHQHPGLFTVDELSGVDKTLGLLAIQEEISKELEINKDEIYFMNAIEFLLVMLYIKPKGNGLTLEQLEKFVKLYEFHSTLPGIDSEACKKVFQELGIKMTEHESKILLQSNESIEKVLMNLMKFAAERSNTVEKNESKLLGQNEIVACINKFNQLDNRCDGLLRYDKYSSFVDKLKMVLNEMKGSEKDSHTFEKGKNILKKFDGSNGVGVKKLLHFAEFAEIVLFCITHIEEKSK
ncbi:uncharacterized protein LOC126845533 [Adelges cooleyi]|uniref:uncharacterized protein LOC126845533 n=1 Tax=Adelges cooleyi TaxID=133065 RepID=UPI00217FCA76|nr:uncharacterized protein LOC126845533 [Adelges cooleyi]